MKTFAQAIPSGVGGSVASKPPSGPPRSESVAASPAPSVCVHCEDRWPRYPRKDRTGWEHFRCSEKGLSHLGPCTNPPPPIERPPEARKPLTHDEASARLHELAMRSSTVSVLARPTYTTHSQPDEEDDDA